MPPNRVIYPLAAAFPVGVLSAITRVAAAFPTVWTMPLLVVSACLWIAGFVLAYEPMLCYHVAAGEVA
jgi:uncharacterized protein involved in response to NO